MSLVGYNKIKIQTKTEIIENYAYEKIITLQWNRTEIYEIQNPYIYKCKMKGCHD